MKNLSLLLLATTLSANVAQAQSEVTFYTSMGDFVVETYDTLQPITAGNFIDLVNAEFYDDVLIHRVVSGFVIQGGDPTGTGFGGPGYTIPDEFDPETSNVQKALAMANSGPNTGGSQFFVNLVNNTFLDTGYPVFGIVIEDFSVVQDIGMVAVDGNDRPIVDVVMDSLRVTHVGPYVGINELESHSFDISVYPNPAEDQFTLTLGKDAIAGMDYQMQITDIIGQTIHTLRLTQSQTLVDISAIVRSGIYFVNIIDDQANLVAGKKVVIR
jgi:cyclophilin family peptidyl-prolyl cis-trans isomerase